MFTGIVQGKARIVSVSKVDELMRILVLFPDDFLKGITAGASISLNGCCLTVTSFTHNEATFDLVPETVARTSFKGVASGSVVNAERSLRFGDEVGGHILSGHVETTARISENIRFDHSRVMSFAIGKEWMKFLFEKGYVAINGASLTITKVNAEEGVFTVSLIPETLSKTTFGDSSVGDVVNIELDKTTHAIVATVERVLAERR